MAGYNELRGLRVEYLSADPANPENGQVWYNSTTGNLRVQGIGVGAWSSGANMIVAGQLGDGLGVQDAALRVGGESPAATNVTEEYNGSGWSSGANYPITPNIVEIGLFGVQTAGIGMGGYVTPAVSRPNTTNEYNGSTWTAGGTYPIGASNIRGAGTLTAGLGFGGDRYPTSPRNSNVTAEYNGSTWTAGGNLGTAGYAGMGGGTQTAGIYNGGTGRTTSTEEYNGSAWTGGGAPPIAQSFGGSSGQGPQTNFSTFGINGTPSGYHQSYDGSTWTAQPALSTPRYALGGAGSSANSTVAFGGRAPAFSSATEEFNFSTTTITAAAWSSGGALNTSRFGLTGFGAQTAAIAANGDTFPPATGRYTAGCEEYNGASWTSIASTNTSTSFAGSSKLSPAGAGSVFGGEPVSARHEYWDGSTWSEQTDMNTPRYGSAGAGTQTSSLAMAGIADTDATEEWDGSSWTTVANIPFATFNTPGAGSQTAAIIFGGNGPSGLNTTAEYNSGTWTAGGNLISPKTSQGGAGTQTAALSFMGSFPTTASVVTTTEGYDGTAWSTRPSASTARRTLGSSGTSTAALGFGGYAPPKTAATEEFTGETVSNNPASNLSVS